MTRRLRTLTAALLLTGLTLTAVQLAFPPVHGGLQLLAVMLTFAGAACGARYFDQVGRADA